jgi:hypothetical protein
MGSGAQSKQVKYLSEEKIEDKIQQCNEFINKDFNTLDLFEDYTHIRDFMFDPNRIDIVIPLTLNVDLISLLELCIICQKHICVDILLSSYTYVQVGRKQVHELTPERIKRYFDMGVACDNWEFIKILSKYSRRINRYDVHYAAIIVAPDYKTIQMFQKDCFNGNFTFHQQNLYFPGMHGTITDIFNQLGSLYPDKRESFNQKMSLTIGLGARSTEQLSLVRCPRVSNTIMRIHNNQ